jgi:isoquinoline 1-oxidoreductase subunit beta
MVDRRSFLKTSAAVGGGMVVAFYVPGVKAALSGQTPRPQPLLPFAYVKIATDETVTIVANHSEMGQGVYTSLPMLLNEELQADWARIRVESAPVDATYNHPVFGMQMTGGSTTTAAEWNHYRQLGAAARVVLIGAAAQQWKVDASTCRVEKGVVIHGPTSKRATFGSLAASAARLPVPADIPLKDPKNFTLIGKPMPRLDTPSKTNGSAQFGLDVVLPGMLTAVIARSPVFGGKVASFDAAEAQQVPGVKAVVQVPSGIAVIAERFWPAKLGRDKLKIKWDEGENAGISTTKMLADFSAQSASPGALAKRTGDPQSALASAAKEITAEYDVPYLAHAMMEPLNCVVDLRADSCEIWTGTQFETVDRANAAKTAGLSPEKVQIHTTLLGGGFGRRANPASDFVIEAVQVAKVAKAPVKVVWTREDDTQCGWYRPMWHDRFAAGLDAS